jgi:hypothetical protein
MTVNMCGPLSWRVLCRNPQVRYLSTWVWGGYRCEWYYVIHNTTGCRARRNLTGTDLLIEAQAHLQYHNDQKQDQERSEIESCCSLLIDKVRAKKWLTYVCWCDERLKTKTEGSTRLAYTGLLGGLEHLKTETRLINEMFVSVMGECVTRR